jgi:hypothetical protein
VRVAARGRIDGEETRIRLMASSRRASSEIRQVMDTQTPRDVAQSLPIHREESAQQSAVAQFLDPTPPAFGVASQPFQDSGHFGRDHGFAIAEQPAREVDQKHVTPYREPFDHPFTR